jgi:hypothetical protein
MNTKWLVEEFPCNFWDSLILALDQTGTEYKVVEIGSTDFMMAREHFHKGDCVFWYGPINKLLNRSNVLPYWPGAICTEKNYNYEWLLNNYSMLRGIEIGTKSKWKYKIMDNEILFRVS